MVKHHKGAAGAEGNRLVKVHPSPASPAEDSLAGRSGIYEAQQREPGKDRHHHMEWPRVKPEGLSGKQAKVFPPFLKAVLKNGFQEGKVLLTLAVRPRHARLVR